MILILVLLSAGFDLSAQVYTVDAPASQVKWQGRRIASGHEGTIEVKSGQLEMKAGKLVSATVTIDMNTIRDVDLELEDRRLRLENHLKSDDFFSVEKYPEATFTMKESSAQPGGKFILKGDLTIKGTTKPVEFETTLSTSGKVLKFTGRIEVDRTLYDVRYGSGKFFENLGERAINDIFTLDFELHSSE